MRQTQIWVTVRGKPQLGCSMNRNPPCVCMSTRRVLTACAHIVPSAACTAGQDSRGRSAWVA